MEEDLEKVQLLARDLRNGKESPRSPRETLGGYALAARALDKCRAVLVGWQGEYHSNCPLDQTWLKFAEIEYNAYRSFVATGATDMKTLCIGRAHPETFTRFVATGSWYKGTSEQGSGTYEEQWSVS